MSQDRWARSLRQWEILPELDRNQTQHKSRLARIILTVYFLFLGIWLIGIPAYRVITEAPYPHPVQADLLFIGLLAAAGVGAGYLLYVKRVLLSAFLLSAAVFLLSAILCLVDPQRYTIASMGFVFSILLSGVVIGGTSVYIYAIGSILVSSLVWASSTVPGSPVSDPLTWISETGLVIGQMALNFTLAITLHSLYRHDVTSRKRLQRQADHMSTLALTDPLTSIANRRQFLDQLEREFNRSRRYRRPLSLLYVDLDGFKEINDHFGHMVGDEVLRGVARSLLSALRASDLLARIGGDEFAVLLPETNLSGALEVSNKLRKALAAYSRSSSLESSLPPLTFCAGVSQRHERDQSIDDMLARADGAQYLAKATGKAHTRIETEID